MANPLALSNEICGNSLPSLSQKKCLIQMTRHLTDRKNSTLKGVNFRLGNIDDGVMAQQSPAKVRVSLSSVQLPWKKDGRPYRGRFCVKVIDGADDI